MDAWTFKTILQIATIGFYEPEKSLDMQIQRDDGLDIFVGRIQPRGPLMFNMAVAGCVDFRKNMHTDGRTFLRCLPEEVHIRNLESWQKTLNAAVGTIMINQGLASHFTCELAELAIFGEGYGENFLDPSAVSPTDEKAELKVATVIVIAKPDDKYSGGKIRVKSTHHDKHREYDFRTNSEKGLISVLLCFNGPGTKVETDPVRDGHRLHLIYNVYVNHSDLAITSAKRMGQLCMNVMQLALIPSLRSTENPVLLGLVQILAQTYKDAPKPPAGVLEFHCQITDGAVRGRPIHINCLNFATRSGLSCSALAEMRVFTDLLNRTPKKEQRGWRRCC